MNKPAKLIPIGNSTGVILPKDVLARLQLRQGDQVTVVVTPEGIELRRHDPEFEEQMSVARAVMEERKKALRELAK
jgi:putative addiction module antidote